MTGKFLIGIVEGFIRKKKRADPGNHLPKDLLRTNTEQGAMKIGSWVVGNIAHQSGSSGKGLLQVS